MIGRPLTSSKIQWYPVVRRFRDLWQAIKDHHADDDPETPKISKTLTIIRWTNAFRDHLCWCVGARHIPLAHVVRFDNAVEAICHILEHDHPYSTEHSLLEGNLIARSSRAHGLFRDNNANIYYTLKVAAQGTSYVDIIKPYQRRKNSRAKFLALLGQYAGAEKWEHKIKKQSDLLHMRTWKGQSKFPLERFV